MYFDFAQYKNKEPFDTVYTEQSECAQGKQRLELLKIAPLKVVTTSALEVVEEFLRDNQNITRKIEGRLVYTD